MANLLMLETQAFNLLERLSFLACIDIDNKRINIIHKKAFKRFCRRQSRLFNIT